MSKAYWSGATWIYVATIENGAGGGGTVSVTVTPGVGNEMELLYGSIINQDTAGRVVDAHIRDPGGNFIVPLVLATAAAGARRSFPTDDVSADNGPAHPSRMILSGGMDLFMRAISVAASEDATFSLVARVLGGVPTATEAGNSTPTITVTTETIL